jgi:hypothetical protein
MTQSGYTIAVIVTTEIFITEQVETLLIMLLYSNGRTINPSI